MTKRKRAVYVSLYEYRPINGKRWLKGRDVFLTGKAAEKDYKFNVSWPRFFRKCRIERYEFREVIK